MVVTRKRERTRKLPNFPQNLNALTESAGTRQRLLIVAGLIVGLAFGVLVVQVSWDEVSAVAACTVKNIADCEAVAASFPQ
jgi:hypothetical protein